LTAGGAHHTVMTNAVGIDAFRDFAEIVDTELLVIDEQTTLATFHDSVRWNAAYYRLAAGL
jgi:L-arabinose isomerase